MRKLSSALAILGIAAGHLLTPSAAASDGFPAGYLYLATTDGVIELDSTGSTIRTLNVGGAANGVAFAPNGNLYVTVSDQDEVVEVTPDGSIAMTITGVTGQPFGICVGPSGQLYVTAWGSADVRVYSPNGAAIATYGTGTLSGGAGLTFGPGGNLFVCSSNADQLVELAPDGTHLGDRATGATIQGPRDVLLTPRGTMVVGTWTSNALFQTDLDGAVMHTDASTSAPQAIAMGSDGFLYVGDVQTVTRYVVGATGFTYEDDFANPTISVGSIYDMAFSPQRIEVKVSGRMVGASTFEKIKEKVTISLGADGYQVMLMPDPNGTLANSMAPFVGYGPELHAEFNQDGKRTYLASSVPPDATENGVSLISVDGKGYLDIDDRFFTKKIDGTLLWWSQGKTYRATIKGKKQLN